MYTAELEDKVFSGWRSVCGCRDKSTMFQTEGAAEAKTQRHERWGGISPCTSPSAKGKARSGWHGDGKGTVGSRGPVTRMRSLGFILHVFERFERQ